MCICILSFLFENFFFSIEHQFFNRKLLNNKEKFMIKVFSNTKTQTKQAIQVESVESNRENQKKIDFLFLDLEECFGTEEININKEYEGYIFTVKLIILDKKQEEEYNSYKNLNIAYRNMKQKHDELSDLTSYRPKASSFEDCFKFINKIFELEELGNDITGTFHHTIKNTSNNNISISNNKVVDFSFKNKEIHHQNNDSVSGSFIEEDSSFFENTNSFIGNDKSRLKSSNVSSNPLHSLIKSKLNASLKEKEKEPSQVIEQQVIFNSINNQTNAYTQENVFTKINTNNDKLHIISNESNVNTEIPLKKTFILTNNKNILKNKLVNEKNSQFKAESNPFKKSPLKASQLQPSSLKINKNEKATSSFEVNDNNNDEKSKGLIDKKLIQIIDDKNINLSSLKYNDKGSLIDILNIGINGSCILFATSFKVSKAYENYIRNKNF